jgi:hypothetical protein
LVLTKTMPACCALRVGWWLNLSKGIWHEIA